jgi:hypothetical protein
VGITAEGAGEGVASEPDVIDLPGESLDQDNARLGVENELAPDLAARHGTEDGYVLGPERILSELDIAFTNGHEGVRYIQDDATAKELGPEIAPVGTELQHLLDQFRYGDIPILRRRQSFAVPEGEHVVVDPSPFSDAVPEADRHAGAKHGRDHMPLFMGKEAAGNKVMRVFTLLRYHHEHPCQGD